MTNKELVEEIIEYFPDNCSAEYLTDEDTAWYSEDDIVNYLKSVAKYCMVLGR